MADLTPTSSAEDLSLAAPDTDTETDDMLAVAHAIADEARSFLTTVTEVGSGTNPEAAIPLLLLAISDLLAAGSRLGAIVDVVPPERYEPDIGPDADVDPLRVALLGSEVTASTVSGDLVTVTGALVQGLRHYESGHELEALWWWQFSYLSHWGERASSALRVLQTMLAHLRLDVDDDVAAEAEYDALQI
jgi:hypothetical protein